MAGAWHPEQYTKANCSKAQARESGNRNLRREALCGHISADEYLFDRSLLHPERLAKCQSYQNDVAKQILCDSKKWLC